MPRPPIPPWLKRRLVPVWNAGHRVTRRWLAVARALARGDFGRCAVCGRLGPWPVEPRAIPPKLVALWGLSPRVAAALLRKETSDCVWCGAKLRARRLSRVLLDEFPVTPPARSVADWVGRPEARALHVAEINLVEGLHKPLTRLPNLSFSDFTPDAPPGVSVAGVRSEDLTRLTYPDGSFDLVVTSESLEHVPDLGAALGELRRVLAPGGRHLFTVPLVPGVSRTFARSVILPDGTLERRAPEIRHPGGDVGYPVFTEFGADLPEILRAAGFEVEVRYGPTTEDDLAQVYVTRVPG